MYSSRGRAGGAAVTTATNEELEPKPFTRQIELQRGCKALL